MLNIKSVSITTGIFYGLLGIKRGMNDYDYRYKKYSNRKESYLYSKKIYYGLHGFILYINPLLLFITLPKEIYRLEVNIRNMENEKKKDYYNEI